MFVALQKHTKNKIIVDTQINVNQNNLHKKACNKDSVKTIFTVKQTHEKHSHKTPVGCNIF